MRFVSSIGRNLLDFCMRILPTGGGPGRDRTQDYRAAQSRLRASPFDSPRDTRSGFQAQRRFDRVRARGHTTATSLPDLARQCGSLTGKGRHYHAGEATQALVRTSAAYDHVFDPNATQIFQLAQNLFWSADQATRLHFLRRVIIARMCDPPARSGQCTTDKMRSWNLRLRSNAAMQWQSIGPQYIGKGLREDITGARRRAAHCQRNARVRMTTRGEGMTRRVKSLCMRAATASADRPRKEKGKVPSRHGRPFFYLPGRRAAKRR